MVSLGMRTTLAALMLLLGLHLSLFCRSSLSLPVPHRMLDLTYDFFNMTPTYPRHKKFEIQNPHRVQLKPDLRYKTEEFTTSEHAGTHMDAPDHFVDNRLTIDQIPIEHFEAPAVVVNISAKASQDPDAEVSVEDLKLWEEEHGRIPPKSVVIMYSGWGRFWQNETAYFGGNDTADLHFPGFSGDACEWLASERDVVGVGGDTVSADVGKSHDFPCHLHILNVNGYILENVANVEQLPPSGAILKAYPMKIKGGTGAPTRVIAAIPTRSSHHDHDHDD